MKFTIDNPAWRNLSYEEKNHALYLRQVDTLDMFLERGAITQAEHDKSLHDLTVKMGEAKISDTNGVVSTKQMLALQYYTQNRASVGCCAKIAGMTEEEFAGFLGQNEVSIFRCENEAELAADFANA